MSRHTPWRRSRVSSAAVYASLAPEMYAMRLRTHSAAVGSRARSRGPSPSSVCAVGASTSEGA